MLVIADARAELWRYPMDPPMGNSTSCDVVVTTLTARDGQTGMGFAHVIMGKDDLPLLAAKDQLERLVVGQELTHPQQLWRRIVASFGRNPNILRLGWGPHVAALASIDVAAWDLYAKSLGVPIGVAMGGAPRRVAVYGGEGFERMQSLEDAKEAAAMHMRAGARGIKIRGNCTPYDRKLLQACAEVLDGKMDLMIDVNQTGTLASASRTLHYAAEFGVRFVEEPLPVTYTAGYEELSRTSPAPIAMGENLRGAPEAAPFVINRWCSLIQPDLAQMGGLTECLRVAQLAEHCNLEVAPHFLPGIFIQLAAAVPHLTWLEDHPTIEGIFSEQPRMEPDGYMTLPAAPGHGLVLSDDARAEFKIA
jgi:L-alanine-DL-glutamate epimerase-like enolase superfamily enzyme